MSDDLTAIKQLKYRYVRLLDTKQWDEFAECFIPEATADYAGLAFADRDALVSYMRENLTERVISMHNVHHPEIVVNGDTASGVWYLHDKVFALDWDVALEGAAFYRDQYVRTNDGWRLARTEYQRTWELTSSLADLPSAKLKLPE